jgi:GT2 family glycosyltransferase
MSSSAAELDIEAVICIPTFRRTAGLERTLASLVAQAGDVRFAVVVVDNDAQLGDVPRFVEIRKTCAAV